MKARRPYARLLAALVLCMPISIALAQKEKVELSLAAPANGTVITAPASLTLSAIARAALLPAAAAEHSLNNPQAIAAVEFFAGATLLGTVAGPLADNVYAFNWVNPAPGVYSISARASNGRGDSAISSAVSVTVNAPPSVSLSTPAAVVTAPGTITLTASPADTDGTIQKVDFFRGTTLLGTAAASPYQLELADLPSGTYTFSAVATDNHAATGSSAAVTVRVNSPPTVTLTSTDTSFRAPASIPLTALVLDTDGTIAKVELFNGSELIATLTADPFSATWAQVPEGTYALTALVTDDLGASVSSSSIVINVSAGEPKLYFIHVDHLNTPRLITDSLRRTVWRWENSEPFGDSPSDENPSGLGVFKFELGFPGQRRDLDTGNWQNWMRDYSSVLGRYVQSDPVGLEAGLNTYAYVGSMPLRYSDPTGLESYRCRRPLGGLPGKNKRSGPDIWGNPFYHQYSCTRDPKTKKLVCGGQGFSESWLSSPGKATTPQTDYYDADACEKTQDDNPCFEKCLIDEWGKKRPKYGMPFGIDCQEYDEGVNNTCREKCNLK